MNEETRTLIALARHEAGHTIVNAALGCPVRYTYIRYIDGSLLGMTGSVPRLDMRKSEKVAILYAGLLADRDYRHLRLNAPPLRMLAVQRQASSRLRRAIARHRFDQIDADAILPGGDLGQIQRLLAGCRDPDRISRRGEILARRALDSNEIPLRKIAQHLLVLGDLRGETLRDLLRQIVHIDTHSRI